MMDQTHKLIWEEYERSKEIERNTRGVLNHDLLEAWGIAPPPEEDIKEPVNAQPRRQTHHQYTLVLDGSKLHPREVWEEYFDKHAKEYYSGLWYDVTSPTSEENYPSIFWEAGIDPQTQVHQNRTVYFWYYSQVKNLLRMPGSTFDDPGVASQKWGVPPGTYQAWTVDAPADLARVALGAPQRSYITGNIDKYLDINPISLSKKDIKDI